MPKYGKTRGHHCWWLTIDGESAANFDNESDVDAIVELDSQLKNTQNLLAEYACKTGAGANNPSVHEALLYGHDED
ncbi:hypothetical protein [Psychromonas ossibalaenae]|uniref:hypothetical protein n=1 Tax=Psychromonas ossibalaenae TaxID=444922 RepID=UPI00036FF2B9|nr:hypothetical protein [Psychromonas ossibalaenae]